MEEKRAPQRCGAFLGARQSRTGLEACATAHAKTPPCDGRCRSLGSRFRWARGWSPERCLCLRTCNAQFRGHGASGGGWAVVLADACTTLGSELASSPREEHRFGNLCHARCILTRSLARAPLRRAARVARESSGETSPGSWPGRWKPEETRARELARLYLWVRGHWRAHKRGCWWVLRGLVCARVGFLRWERGGLGMRFILES